MIKVRISDGRICKTLKGGIGSIRSLFVNEEDLLLCVGTGKYLRIHDVKKRFKTVVKEIYLKQRLTSLVVFPKEIKNDAGKYFEAYQRSRFFGTGIEIKFWDQKISSRL